MTSSGLTAYDPDLGDVTLEAFSRIGIHPPSITANHMANATRSARFLLVDWDVIDGPNLFKQELLSISLVQGTPTYPIPSRVVAVTDWYIQRMQPDGVTTQDRVVTPLSRTEYAAIPEKTTQAFPTSVFFLRTRQPTVTLWQVPDGNGPYLLFYWAVTQIEDAVMNGGVTMDMPHRFLEAFASGLAAKLARKFPPPPPTTVADLQADADKAWMKAAKQDTEEMVALNIIPGLSSYYR